MSIKIFESVPNWSFSQADKKAKNILSHLRLQSFQQLPPEIKSHRITSLFKQIQQTKLYQLLQTMPKGVIHHVHFDCCEDQEFYAQHVVTDPIVYLNKNMDAFQLGTKQQAESEGWFSMAAVREKFENEKQFLNHISNITMLNKQQLSGFLTKSTAECWDLFEKKIVGIFPILGAVHLFKKYTIHILNKYVKNGYDRIQFRALLTNLNQYNQSGEIIKVHDKRKFMQTVDEAFEVVKKQHPILSIGFIFFALKFLTPQQNEKILTQVLQLKWEKTIGIDFVQQQDPNGSQAPYDEIAERVLNKFPDEKIKKVYHAGQTRDHLNRNVEISIKSGSVRIGHGINVVQHPQLIQICKEKQICFEKCPISNLVLNYVNDPRAASPQLLLGLGVPVSLSPDDPARFGLDDSTMDFFVSFISSNWSLEHLKVLGIYSINHAICGEEMKQKLVGSFNKRWESWIGNIVD